MDETNELQCFFDRCDAFTRSSFIVAKPRLTELLKSITASPTLTMVFASVAEGFDYAKAKTRCLVTTGTKDNPKKTLILPKSPTDKLAFIFLLLCEFDRGDVAFNDFIFTYFYREENYSASFNAFCDGVIEPLKTIVYEAFYDENSLAGEKLTEKLTKQAEQREAANRKQSEAKAQPPAAEPPEAAEQIVNIKAEAAPSAKAEPAEDTVEADEPEEVESIEDVLSDDTDDGEPDIDDTNFAAYTLIRRRAKKKSGLFASKKIKKVCDDVLPLVIKEKGELSKTDLDEKEKLVGISLLNSAVNYIGQSDVESLKLALIGYNYYLAYNRYVSDNVRSAFKLIKTFESEE